MNPPPLRRRLYIVWLVLMILLTGIVLHEATDLFDPTPTPRAGRLPMFAFREPDLSRVQIIHQGRVAALRRDAAGMWLHSGTNAPHPSAAAIAERLSLIARMLADRRVTPTQRLNHYGLNNPKTLIAFYGRQDAQASSPLATLYIGDLLPTQYAYYAMRPGDRELSLIPRYYIALLLALAFGEEQAPTPLPARNQVRSSGLTK